MVAFVAIALGIAILALLAVAHRHARSRRPEARPETLLANLPRTVVCTYDRDLRLELVRGRLLEARGISPSEVEGKRLPDYLDDEYGRLIVPLLERALEGESGSFEFRPPLSGPDMWLGVVPLTRGGRILGGLAIAVDISERKEAERRGERSEAGRRRIVDAMNESYVAIEADGTVSDWNDRATQIFGYSRDEAIGAPAPDLIVPPDDRKEFWWLLERFTVGERSDRTLDMRLERTALHKDGHTFPIELAATTIHHGSGVVLHTFMHDITERRRSRDDLEAHAADLEAMVDAAGELARSTTAAQARESICRAASRIAAAEVACLLEPTRDGSGLHVTAAVGVEGEDLGLRVMPFDGLPSGSVRSFRSREILFSADCRNDPEVLQSMVELLGARSAMWVPVAVDDTAVGVVAVAWREPVEEVPERVRKTLQLTAAEAAVAIERSRLLERLERMARTDDLTGLPNRRAWDEELRREMIRARRRQRPLSVAMVDLDHFKDYNDAHGHQAGDRLLKEAAGAWRSALREGDTLTRYGGEEFAIALPDCDRQEAASLIDRLRTVTPHGESCSAGVATWDRSARAADLVGHADAALYEAKQSGRDRTVVH